LGDRGGHEWLWMLIGLMCDLGGVHLLPCLLASELRFADRPVEGKELIVVLLFRLLAVGFSSAVFGDLAFFFI